MNDSVRVIKIIYHFHKECPDIINYNELYTTSYDEINKELVTHYPIPELLEEEKLAQFYAAMKFSARG